MTGASVVREGCLLLRVGGARTSMPAKRPRQARQLSAGTSQALFLLPFRAGGSLGANIAEPPNAAPHETASLAISGNGVSGGGSARAGAAKWNSTQGPWTPRAYVVFDAVVVVVTFIVYVVSGKPQQGSVSQLRSAVRRTVTHHACRRPCMCAQTLELADPRQVFMVQATLYKHSYPYKENSVPSWAVPLYSIGGPLVAFLVWKLVERRRPVTWYDL